MFGKGNLLSRAFLSPAPAATPTPTPVKPTTPTSTTAPRAPPAHPHPPELLQKLNAAPVAPQLDYPDDHDGPDPRRLASLVEEAMQGMTPEEALNFQDKMRAMQTVLQEELNELEQQDQLIRKMSSSGDIGATNVDRPSLKNMKKKTALSRSYSDFEALENPDTTIRQLREALLERQNEVSKLRLEVDSSRLVRQTNRDRMHLYEESLQLVERNLIETSQNLAAATKELAEKNALLAQLESKQPIDTKAMQRLRDAKDKENIELKTRVASLEKENSRQARIIDRLERELEELKAGKAPVDAVDPSDEDAVVVIGKSSRLREQLREESAVVSSVTEAAVVPQSGSAAELAGPATPLPVSAPSTPVVATTVVSSSNPPSPAVAPAAPVSRKAVKSILKPSGLPNKNLRRLKFAQRVLMLDGALDGDLDLVKECIASGADVNQPNEEGLTPLHSSSCNGHGAVVTYLLGNGAKINVTDDDGWTPLHGAACFGEVNVVKALVESGANIVAENAEGDAPLDIADDTATKQFLKQALDERAAASSLYALYDYAAGEEDELSFSRGEKLDILTEVDKREEDVWWLAKSAAQGKQGLVPSNFLGLYKPLH